MAAERPIKHATVMVLIITQETPARALLLKHSKHERWMAPGGHQEAWENPLEAAIREVKEETGADVTEYLPKVEYVEENASIVPSPSRLVEVKIPPRRGDPEHYHIDQTYVARVPKPFDIAKNEEAEEYAWLRLDEMNDIFVPPDVRLALEQEMKQ
jgi:8-oxo-dGTP pyrophosphatase MutT (NUDIX family)